MMKQPRAIIFLDIDEVLSLLDKKHPAEWFERWGRGLVAWPIPLAYPLLRALDQDSRFLPIWLTCWGKHALLWNERAGTSPFPVGYPLTRRQAAYARRCIPDYPEQNSGEKLLAVRYFLRHDPSRRAIWIEDGFSAATEAWAAQTPLVRLLDTTKEPLRSFLLASHTDLDQAVGTFIATYLLDKNTGERR